jgi:hypothetical protein
MGWETLDDHGHYELRQTRKSRNARVQEEPEQNKEVEMNGRKEGRTERGVERARARAT